MQVMEKRDAVRGRRGDTEKRQSRQVDRTRRELCRRTREDWSDQELIDFVALTNTTDTPEIVAIAEIIERRLAARSLSCQPA
jgi:hypothetical protein